MVQSPSLTATERALVAAVGYLMLAVAARGEEIPVNLAVLTAIKHAGIDPFEVDWHRVVGRIEEEIAGA